MTDILGATEHSEIGHDVADFFRSFKKACTPPECKPVTFGVLRTGARLTLADPLLSFSVFGFARSYITEGKATSAIPMTPLRRLISYLPSLGFQMTPCGTEHIFRNLLEKSARERIGG